jgi:hypothetical protein
MELRGSQLNNCCDINTDSRHEEVITENEVCKEAHRLLFRFDESVYMFNNGNLYNHIEARVKSGTIRLHLSGTWSWILRIALQKEEPPEKGEAFYLLKNLGMKEVELQPFHTSDINDIFYSLYYGKRFDVLRRLCHRAKREVEERLNNPSITIHCHLVAPEITQIVASSL